MSNGASHPCPAYVEEFSEEAQTIVPETKQSANVGAARQPRPDALGNFPSAGRGAFSDSEPSTTTYGTEDSSLNTKLETAQNNAQLAAATALQPPKRVTIEQGGDYDGRARSQERTVQLRSNSQTRRDATTSSGRRECHCEDCMAALRRITPSNYRRESSIPPPFPATAPNPELYEAYQQTDRLPRSQPSAPPSPLRLRAQINASDTAPREHLRPRAAYPRIRPVSFHAGTVPDAYYVPRRSAETTYAADPSSVSRAPPVYPVVRPSYLPPTSQPVYYQPSLAQQSAIAPPAYLSSSAMPYENQPSSRTRPRIQQYASARSAPRPQSMYYDAPPLPVDCIEKPIYQNAEAERGMPTERQLSRRERRTSLRDSYGGLDEDSRRMPPPPPPLQLPPPPPQVPTDPESRPRSNLRPAIRHASTTPYPSVDMRRLPSGDGANDRQLVNRTSRKPSMEDDSRRGNLGLNSMARSGSDRGLSSGLIADGAGRIASESANLSPDSRRHQRGRSSVYESLEKLEGSVEAYQASKSGSSPRSAKPPKPSEDDMLRLVRNAPQNSNTRSSTSDTADSRASAFSGHSTTATGHSSTRSRDESDRKASKIAERRISGGAATMMRSDSDRLASKANPEGILLKMPSGNEGRAISLRKSKDDDVEMEANVEDRQDRSDPRDRPVRPSLYGHTGSGSTEKSLRRYSYIAGQQGGVTEVDAIRQLGWEASFASRTSGSNQARIIGERVITTIRSRRRSSSRYRNESQREGDPF